MSTQKRAGSMMMVWFAIAIAFVAVFAFVGGYFVGSKSVKAEPYTIVDDYGRSVTLDGIPQKIVSLAPTPTEILYAVGAGSQVIGVDDYSDYPEAAKALPKVGSFPINVEAVVALQPDLIVSSDLVPRQQLEQLEAQGMPYVIFADRTLEDVFKTMTLAGVITGHVTEANAAVQALSARVDAVTNKTLAENVSAPWVYVEYYPMWTYGPGSFGDDIIKLAGGRNVAENTSSEYPQVTDEFVIAQDPTLIVYTVGVMSTTTPESISARPGWGNITAVAQGHIYSIDDNLLSRYGPRVVDGLEELAALIHPELFP